MYDHKQSLKEVIKHTLFRCGLTDTLDMLRRWRGRHVGHMRKRDMIDIFSQIYARGVWVEHDSQDSLSGVGSSRMATEDLAIQLSAFLRNVQSQKMVDIGCGDFGWMGNVEGGFEYLGIDVVPQVVVANNAKYGNEKRKFVCMDATRTSIETGDVAVCREVLFHLSFEDGLQLLRNIKAAEFKYVLFTNDKSIWFNSNIRTGDFRRINLSRGPFNFPEPLRELTDDKVSSGRVLAIWPSVVLPN